MWFNLMEGKYTLWLYQCRDKEWEEYTEDTGKEQDCMPVNLHVCVVFMGRQKNVEEKKSENDIFANPLLQSQVV